jgi:hypothetical protein
MSGCAPPFFINCLLVHHDYICHPSFGTLIGAGAAVAMIDANPIGSIRVGLVYASDMKYSCRQGKAG